MQLVTRTSRKLDFFAVLACLANSPLFNRTSFGSLNIANLGFDVKYPKPLVIPASILELICEV
jgi:hypothetical protein